MIVNARGRRRLGRMVGGVAAGELAVGAVARAATAGVPWSKVGPGWELAEYTTGRPPGDPGGGAAGTSPVTLYLISPAGVRYPMHTWRSQATAPYMIAWSGDKT